MNGDKLASGAPSATFGGPQIKIDPAEMQRDLHQLPAAAFQEKYWCTQSRYEQLLKSDGEATETLVRQIEEHTEAIERLLAQDKKRDESLDRACFIEPFCARNCNGRMFVSRDKPVAISKLALPTGMRKQRELLPTTGHVVRANVMNDEGKDISAQFVGLRVLFGPMSGTAVYFDGYPTWFFLDVNEIWGIIRREDVELAERELEPMV